MILSLEYNNFGLFVRGSAFYDFENEDGDRERTDLSNGALDLVGKDANCSMPISGGTSKPATCPARFESATRS